MIALPMDYHGPQNLWNPFRDWNNLSYGEPIPLSAPQNLWNPFRDWNLVATSTDRSDGHKTSETLLGIETTMN